VPKNKKLPPSVIDRWPEILDDVEVEVIPVQYLDSVKVYFRDGKIWDIDVKKSLDQEIPDLEEALEDLFSQYEDVIENIDFRLDTERVKRDIQNRTRLFMKKRK